MCGRVQGTVLIRSAEELQGYSRSEEDRLEALIKGIADSGARVVVAGSAIGDMALHFVEKYGMMAVRIPSKFDLRRFCRSVLSPPAPLLVAPAGTITVCTFPETLVTIRSLARLSIPQPWCCITPLLRAMQPLLCAP